MQSARRSGIGLPKALAQASVPLSSQIVSAPSVQALSTAPQPAAAEDAQRSGLPLRLLRLLLFGAAALPAAAVCEAEDSTSFMNKAKALLQQAWADIDQDLHRSEAGLPAQAAVARAEPPRVRCQGDKVSVKFALRPGADLTDVILNMLSHLSDATGPAFAAVQTSKILTEATQSAAARVLQFGPSSGLQLSAQLWIPTAADRQPEIEFVKQGTLTSDDIGSISSVLRSANTLSKANTIVRERSGPNFFSRKWHWSSQDGLSSSSSSSSSDEAAAEPGFGFHGSFGSLGGQLDAMMRLMLGVDDMFEGRRGDEDDEDRGAWGGQGGGFGARGGFPMLPPGGFGGWSGEQHAPAQGSLPHRAPPLEEAQQGSYSYGSRAADAAAQKLQSLGAKVYPPESKDVMDWGILAGYEEQKARIEDTMLLALKHPDIFDEVARGTRRHYSSNCPRAILFEGPPGCGKTTSARVIASQASVPLVYVPLEAVASKWYGESEKLLSQIFEAVQQLEGAIVFLDELDALATTRSAEMHEATRRLLGVLLRQMDGFATGEQKRCVVLGATNRKQDLDPALLSRFDASIRFQLPSQDCRQQIVAQYAQHLQPADFAALAAATDGMSGRDLRDICEQAERSWAAQIIRKQAQRGSFPPAAEYHRAAAQRKQDKHVTPDQQRSYSLGMF